MTHHPVHATHHGRGPSTARLAPRTRGWVNAVGLGVWATGVGWLLLHYFAVHVGEMGPERSPWEPWWLKLHGAFAFLALWTGGLLWAHHIVKAWAKHRRRWTGSMVLGVFFLLILTGYLLYYAGDEDLRNLLSVMHWGLGLGLPLAYLAHRLIRRAPARSAVQEMAPTTQADRPPAHGF